MNDDLKKKLTDLFREIFDVEFGVRLTNKEINLEGYYELLQRFKELHMPKYSHIETVWHVDFTALIDLLQKILGSTDTNLSELNDATLGSVLTNYRQTEEFVVESSIPPFTPHEIELKYNTSGGVILIDINGKLVDLYSDHSGGVGFEHEFGTKILTIREYYSIEPVKDLIRVHYWTMDNGSDIVEPEAPEPEEPQEPPVLTADFELVSLTNEIVNNGKNFTINFTLTAKNNGGDGELQIFTRLNSLGSVTQSPVNVLAGENGVIEFSYNNLLPGSHQIIVTGGVITGDSITIDVPNAVFVLNSISQEQTVFDEKLTWVISFEVEETTGLADGVYDIDFKVDNNDLINVTVDVLAGQTASGSFTHETEDIENAHALLVFKRPNNSPIRSYSFEAVGVAELSYNNPAVSVGERKATFSVGIENIGSADGNSILKFQFYKKYDPLPDFETIDNGNVSVGSIFTFEKLFEDLEVDDYFLTVRDENDVDIYRDMFTISTTSVTGTQLTFPITNGTGYARYNSIGSPEYYSEQKNSGSTYIGYIYSVKLTYRVMFAFDLRDYTDLDRVNDAFLKLWFTYAIGHSVRAYIGEQSDHMDQGGGDYNALGTLISTIDTGNGGAASIPLYTIRSHIKDCIDNNLPLKIILTTDEENRSSNLIYFNDSSLLRVKLELQLT